MPQTLQPTQYMADQNILAIASEWRVHLPSDGSKIGGIDPTFWRIFRDVPAMPGAVMLYMEGQATDKGWPTIMLYSRRRLFDPSIAYLEHTLGFYVVCDTLALRETDLMITIPAPAGTKLPDGSPAQSLLLNASLQSLDYGKGGQLQNVDGSGRWCDIPGAKPGILCMGHHEQTVRVAWQPDGTYGIVDVELDGVVYPVNQKSKGYPSNWLPNGVSVQVQISKAPDAPPDAPASLIILPGSDLLHVIR